jgi:DNA-directed RNA polymerase subunit RPC12/RpoP
MNRTHYFCDICKKEAEKSSDLTGITIHGDQYQRTFENAYKRYDLCVPCGEKLGFKKRVDVEARTVEPTTAEKLYEIIAQIVLESQR